MLYTYDTTLSGPNSIVRLDWSSIVKVIRSLHE